MSYDKDIENALIEEMMDFLGPFGSKKRQMLARRTVRYDFFKQLIGNLSKYTDEYSVLKIVKGKLATTEFDAARIMLMHDFPVSDEKILKILADNECISDWDDMPWEDLHEEHERQPYTDEVEKLMSEMDRLLGPFGSQRRQMMAKGAVRLDAFKRLMNELYKHLKDEEAVGKIVAGKLLTGLDNGYDVMIAHGFKFTDPAILKIIEDNDSDGHWDDVDL